MFGVENGFVILMQTAYTVVLREKGVLWKAFQTNGQRRFQNSEKDGVGYNCEIQEMIQDKNKEQRVNWACKNLNKTFEYIIWTDESLIQLVNHCTFSYRKVGTAPKPKVRPKHPYKVMVWAEISQKGATRICLLNSAVNSEVYQEIL